MIGRLVGNWRIVRPLGEGSFGTVYEAEHISVPGKRAALKILQPQLAVHPAVRDRFLVEASAASRAEHENIVQIFDGGVTADGICYSAMELLRGRTLGAAIAEGALGASRTINVGVQAASALAAAHEVGIVHRDLKPDNMFLVARATNPEFVKVLDFGIAKLRSEDGRAAGRTRTGMVLGTPGYMSPEQWMSLPDIDGRSDIYSLGIIFFQCMVGQLPFAANTTYEWQLAHLQEPVPNLSQLARVPAALARVVARMVEKRREDRPQSMSEVIGELEAAADAIGGVTSARRHDRKTVPAIDGGVAAMMGAMAMKRAGDNKLPAPSAPQATPVTLPPPLARSTPQPSPSASPVLKAEVPPQSSERKTLVEARPAADASESEPLVTPRHSRGPAIAIALGAMLIVAGIGLVSSRRGEGPKIDLQAEAIRLSEQGAEALAARQWDEAIRLYGLGIAANSRREEWKEQVARARSEKRSQEQFARFEAARARNDATAAIALFEGIAPDSVYRAEASASVQELKRQVAQAAAPPPVAPVVPSAPMAAAAPKKTIPSPARVTQTVGESAPLRPFEEAPAPPAETRAKRDLKDPFGEAAAARPSAEQIQQWVVNAQGLYVAGRYSEASEVANRAVEASEGRSTKAWHIVGAASCKSGDAKKAVAAWRALPSKDRAILAEICARENITLP